MFSFIYIYIHIHTSLSLSLSLSLTLCVCIYEGMKGLRINSKFKVNQYAKAMTVHGIANISENRRMKCVRRTIPRITPGRDTNPSGP